MSPLAFGYSCMICQGSVSSCFNKSSEKSSCWKRKTTVLYFLNSYSTWHSIASSETHKYLQLLFMNTIMTLESIEKVNYWSQLTVALAGLIKARQIWCQLMNSPVKCSYINTKAAFARGHQLTLQSTGSSLLGLGRETTYYYVSLLTVRCVVQAKDQIQYLPQVLPEVIIETKFQGLRGLTVEV